MYRIEPAGLLGRRFTIELDSRRAHLPPSSPPLTPFLPSRCYSRYVTVVSSFPPSPPGPLAADVERDPVTADIVHASANLQTLSRAVCSLAPFVLDTELTKRAR